MSFSFKLEVLKITSRFSSLNITIPIVFLRIVLLDEFLSPSACLSWILEVLHYFHSTGPSPCPERFQELHELWAMYLGLCKASRPLGGAFAPHVSSLQPGSSMSSSGVGHLCLTGSCRGRPRLTSQVLSYAPDRMELSFHPPSNPPFPSCSLLGTLPIPS